MIIYNENEDPDELETVGEVGVVNVEEVDEGVTYPAPENARIGVHTNLGTDPVVTDQGDEQEGIVWGTPDDVGEEEI